MLNLTNSTFLNISLLSRILASPPLYRLHFVVFIYTPKTIILYYYCIMLSIYFYNGWIILKRCSSSVTFLIINFVYLYMYFETGIFVFVFLFCFIFFSFVYTLYRRNSRRSRAWEHRWRHGWARFTRRTTTTSNCKKPLTPCQRIWHVQFTPETSWKLSRTSRNKRFFFLSFFCFLYFF